MQVLKQKIRESILEAARREFHAEGYLKASIKKIAKDANVSVGNVYRYYDNKEALFNALLTPVFGKLIKVFYKQPGVADDVETNLLNAINAVGSVFANDLKDKRRELLTLVDGARGSKFAGAKRQLYGLLADYVKEFLPAYYERRGESADESLAAPVAVSFLEGYFEIFRAAEDAEEIRRAAERYTRFYFEGLSGSATDSA
jgi:AcrR family transcriptional regulator